jgi:hypothetical protein
MAHPSLHADAPDPAPLRRLLATVRRRARLWIWIESLTQFVLAAVGLFWTTLLLDRLIEPPPWLRAAALATAALALAALLATSLLRRLTVPLSDEALALAVERTHPQFGDSLLTSITLAAGGADDADPDLALRTTGAALARLGEVRPRSLFRWRRLSLLATAAVLAAAGVGALAVLQPALTTIWVRRMVFLLPDPWPRQVMLEAEGFSDGVRTVARGSDVELIVRARAAGPLPETAELRSRGPAGWRTLRMGTRGGPTAGGQAFGHVFEAVTEDIRLDIRAGDARLRDLVLHVVDAPALETVDIRYTLPDYLGGGDRHVSPSRIVQVPRGSRVDIACNATKPLAGAAIEARSPGAAAATVIAALTGAANDTRSIMATVPGLDHDLAIAVRFTDTDGLDNRAPIGFTLAAVADAAPRLTLRLAGISGAVTPRALLPIEGTINDDHALGSAEVLLGVGADVRSLPIERVRDGRPEVILPPEAAEVVALEPLGIAAGKRLEVTVVARDRCGLEGGPNVARGDTWTLDVVTPEALQAMLEAREVLLRRRYQAAIDDLAQVRERLVAPAGAGRGGDGDRGGEATARATGEAREIAAAFRGIHRELANNQLLSADVEMRLLAQIAAPLERLADEDLTGLARACRAAAADPAAGGAVLTRQMDAVLARMRAILERMLELESLNEVIERLRGVIRVQEEIRSDTLERQKRRGREALESP